MAYNCWFHETKRHSIKQHGYIIFLKMNLIFRFWNPTFFVRKISKLHILRFYHIWVLFRLSSQESCCFFGTLALIISQILLSSGLKICFFLLSHDCYLTLAYLDICTIFLLIEILSIFYQLIFSCSFMIWDTVMVSRSFSCTTHSILRVFYTTSVGLYVVIFIIIWSEMLFFLLQVIIICW